MPSDLEQREVLIKRISEALSKPRTGIRLDVLGTIVDRLDKDPVLRRILGNEVLKKLGFLSELNDLKIVDVNLGGLSAEEKAIVVERIDSILSEGLEGGG